MRTTPVRERAAETMERWAKRGLGERPPGSNVVPELADLGERLGVRPHIARMGYPWCAYAAFLAALPDGITAALALRDEVFNGLYVPTVLREARARAYGLRIVPAARARRGDLVLFDWSPASGDPAEHLARLVRAPADGVVATVDGNSSGRVALRERPLAQVRAFVRDT